MNRATLSRIAAWPLRSRQPAMPVTIANPPSTLRTSPMTAPIGIVEAIDFLRSSYTSRETLLSIPAFRRAVTLIAGTVGSLPFHAYNANGERVDRPFLTQPENQLGYTRNVTWTRVAQDLLLDGASLMIIQEYYADGYPRSAKLIPFHEWSQDTNTGDIILQGEKVDPATVRLFQSPFNGLTYDAGPTVTFLAKLGQASTKYLDNPAPREYFTPTQGQEPEDDEIEQFLTDWDNRRKQGLTAFIPSSVELHQVEQMDPVQLALVAANDFAIAEVSRLTGIDATWLSINVSTRTYSNIIDERRNFLDFVCATYIQSIEQRLSLGDTTPTGTYVKANLDAFLRANTLDRYTAHQMGLQNGFLEMEEVRRMEDRPPLVNSTNIDLEPTDDLP